MIDAVGAPVGHFAAGKVAPSHPAHPLPVERPRGGLIEPHVPIQPGGNRLLGKGRGGAGGGPRIIDRTHFQQLAQAAAANQLAADAVDGHRLLLRPDLQNAAVSADRVDQGPALLDVERQRFLGIDVLAGLASVDAGQHALKLARRHDHRVDVLAVEQLAIVLIDGPIAPFLGFEALGPRQVAIAQGDQLRVVGQLVQQQRGTTAHADRAHPGPIVRTRAGAIGVGDSCLAAVQPIARRLCSWSPCAIATCREPRTSKPRKGAIGPSIRTIASCSTARISTR